MYDPKIVSMSRRAAIVRREGGDGVSRVIAAELRDGSELSFALRWLLDHYTYKRSKAGGTRQETVSEIMSVMRDVEDSFVEDVVQPCGLSAEPFPAPAKLKTAPISGLGHGEITNPFDFIDR